MKVRIHASFLLYILLIGVFASWVNCISALLALLVHELGHYLTGIVFGEEISSIELTPFGGVMHRRSNKTSLKGLRGIMIALAGPFSNYIFICLLTSLPCFRVLKPDTLQKLMLSNLVMMGMNLLPVLPLDGGNAAFSIGYYFFRVDSLIAFLTGMGQITGGILNAVALFGFFKAGTLNCSLLIVGSYLIKYASSQRKTLRSENLYLILREQLDRKTDEIKRMALYSVSPCTPLYAALTRINQHTESVFLVQTENELRLVGEKKLCFEMLHDPNLLFDHIAVPVK